ncbi:hypothetical protein ATOBIA_N16190 [Atopobiaceae bacterium P1]|uniref:Uncharacterized protein n=1 Tax=Leptogranulimonas caecicola TaxID=2894156 RepID=A0AAU9D9B4_9ACTN|nr:hypothetical protein ATOBIA_N16190 [Atopobiaceae bacterium P1]BDC91714.1 hypothetical protein ATTO_15860 [Leptogranulimonas caecicola]
MLVALRKAPKRQRLGKARSGVRQRSQALRKEALCKAAFSMALFWRRPYWGISQGMLRQNRSAQECFFQGVPGPKPTYKGDY